MRHCIKDNCIKTILLIIFLSFLALAIYFAVVNKPEQMSIFIKYGFICGFLFLLFIYPNALNDSFEIIQKYFKKVSKDGFEMREAEEAQKIDKKEEANIQNNFIKMIALEKYEIKPNDTIILRSSCDYNYEIKSINTNQMPLLIITKVYSDGKSSTPVNIIDLLSTSKVIIGRGYGDLVSIDDIVISRKHLFVCRLDDGKVFALDLYSTNGSYLKRL
jgi:hypothetical protein